MTSNPQIEYYDNGQKKLEIYRDNRPVTCELQSLHKTDGPAYTEWHENGQKKLKHIMSTVMCTGLMARR